MKIKIFGMFAMALWLCAGALATSVKAQQIECEGKLKSVKTVAVENYQGANAVFNFPTDGIGHFSSTPLLSTTIEVGGRQRSCLVARFSSEAIPLDNYVVFQATIDGVPMKGHLPSFFGIPTPAVFDAEETDLNLERMVAHDFFAIVEPGTHRVEILFAGCCSGAPPPNSIYAFAGASVLTLEYAGN